MENNKKIELTGMNIDMFRALSDDEKFSLIKSITNNAELFAINLLNHEANMNGYDKECKNGHDFIDCQPIRYYDYEEIATSPLYDENSEPGLYEENAKVCRKCAKILRSERKQLRSPTLSRESMFWK